VESRPALVPSHRTNFPPNWKPDAKSDVRRTRRQELRVAAVRFGDGAHDGETEPSASLIATGGDEATKQ
jgi:hypothetical protein